MARSAQLSVSVDGQDVPFYPKTVVSAILDFKESIKTFPTEEDYIRASNLADAATEELEAIAKKMFDPIAPPTASNTELAYTGELQKPNWVGFDPKYMTFIENEANVGAGNYVCKIGLVNQAYRWTDQTKEPKEFPWTIAKVADELSLDKDSVSLNVHNLSEAVTLSHNGDGEVTAVSADEHVATVVVEGDAITVIGIDIGDTTVTVNIAEGTNHFAGSITFAVHVDILTSLANTPLDRIQAAAQNGLAPSLWSVGDLAPIELNGIIDGVDVTGNYKVAILGFNHNKALEGNNKIHFGIMKNESNVNIAFNGFKANATSSNSGGYAISNLRTVMASFLSTMPEAWKNIMVSVKKYTDNIAGGTTGNGNITVTQDLVFLPSLYEITGNNNLANEFEASYQAQYTYYANGNTKVKYAHNSGSVVKYWTRSPGVTSTIPFCYINEGGNGDASEGSASNVYAIAPAFVVG